MTNNIPNIIDKQAHYRNRARAYQHPYHKDYFFLFEAVMLKLIERLHDTAYDFSHGLLLDGYAGHYVELLKQQGILGSKIKQLTVMDCAPYPSRNASDANVTEIIGDAEDLPFSSNQQPPFDIVLAPFHLHWVNDLVGSLIQIKQVLREDGAFFAVMPGAKSFASLRHAMMQTDIELYQGASPHILPFIDVPMLGQLLQRAGFALPVVDGEMLLLEYQDPLKLWHDLRYMGEGNALQDRRKTALNKAYFAKLAEILNPDGAGFEIEIELVFAHGWRPASTQSQPKARGSATISLTDVL